MAQNLADTKQIPLAVWGGLVTNISPPSLPSGASPDCSDISFLPGGISQRPCLHKVFPTPWGTATTTYGKSYVDPKGVIRNLYLDSAGNIWVENVTTSAGVYALLTTTTPGTYAKSITAFGREYIAISDGLHGQEIPLQYDGTNLDRVTQDGPGAPPTVASLAFPPVQMFSNATPPTILTITGIFPDGQAFAGGYFTTINIYVASGGDAVPVGTQVVVSTSTIFDGTYTIIANPGTGGTMAASAFFPAGTSPYVGSGTLTIQGTGSGSITMTRAGNVVTVVTGAPHQLLPGYQSQISGVSAGVVGTSIISATINNEDSPGLATIKMATPHGLVPGLFVSLQGILATAVGGGIVSATRTSEVSTFVTAAPHGLSPGAVITTDGNSDPSLDTTAVVQQVTAPDIFTIIQVNNDATGTGGTVGINWPITASPTPSYFEVTAAPSPTTFQVQVFYPDGSWTGGTASYAWDGKFFTQSVPTPTSFTYRQYGPDATTTDVGTVTPYGQISPGQHQAQVFFIMRAGYTTPPSPPVTFTANGGQYAAVSNIPTGPPNVVARAIAFTGAKGAYFFYIPAPPQVNGQLVGTATQINDNTTTSAVFDFGDNTLFAALGISIPGNNLANEQIIDGALGFGFYGSRLFTYGQRNRIGNLLNMGFDGGALPSSPTIPTGWSGGTGGALVAGHYGQGWTTTVGNDLNQSFYRDYTGAPIGTANTRYTFRAWVSAAGSVIAKINSATTAFSSTATLAATGKGWYQADFTAPMPNTIPADMMFNIAGSGVIVDEMSVIFQDTPYRQGMLASYANNPEAFDGVTGVIGPVDDTHPVMDLGVIRSNLYMLTQDPSGRLHETSQGNTEPAGWVVDEVAANCGAVSAFSLTRSQADDSSAAGGEEWFAWFSSTGARIFGGESPDKISQEIQRPKGQTFPGAPADLGAINTQSLLTVWGLNDPDQKIMWFGIPSGTSTAPSVVYAMNYLGLDSAGEISANSPIHKALSGKMVATDLGRKWSPWRMPINGGALMYRQDGQIQPVFFSGNGRYPNTGGVGGAAYTRAVSAVATLTVAASVHGEGPTPYVIAIDGTGQFVDVAVVNAISGGLPTGNLTINFGAPFTGTLVIGSGGNYTQPAVGATTVMISATTHGQGAEPYVIAIDNAGNFIYPGVVNVGGNLTISFAPAFTGLIVVGSGGSYVVAETGITAVTIPATTHGQGLTPYVEAVDTSGNLIGAIIVNQIVLGIPTGNITVSFAPPFTGVIVIGGGTVQGHGNVYTLDYGKFTDDDYGQMFPYYVTYGFPDRDQEQGLQIGAGMKLVAYVSCFVGGIGSLTISILYESLANVWPKTGVYPLQTGPLFDLEWGGGNCQAQRVFFKFAVTPTAGTDVAVNLTTFTAGLRAAKRMMVRGRYP